VVVLGKGLGNGIPVAAAVGRADLFASLSYGEGSDTYSGNTLATAAVLATLDEFESTNVLEQGQELSQALEAGLTRLKQTPVVDYVRGEGCVWGVQCAAVGSHSADETANACVEACYRGDADGRAIHLLGPLAGNVLRVSPPLVMPVDEARGQLNAMCRIFEDLGRRLGQ
jgi:4-aminobutyrate aminotransferase-like enzyme